MTDAVLGLGSTGQASHAFTTVDLYSETLYTRRRLSEFQSFRPSHVRRLSLTVDRPVTYSIHTYVKLFCVETIHSYVAALFYFINTPVRVDMPTQCLLPRTWPIHSAMK